ncbi:MAG: Inner membrane protein YohK [Candidatus Accumulibacter vicinus]|uniref:Inner membrane protein YohK n=1 Tax=Candidatus Accumulibacter vicinus TaxID=2954382 RepID=A0A084Y2L0_9PROT|nr:MAG: Inner membrane protein YohK [Candidatus Accumulibacter vicinus]
MSDVSGSRKKLGMPDNLAIPLYAQRGRLKRLALPLLVALLVGSLTAALSAVAIGSLFGASRVTLLSLAPIAMGVAERIGGLPSLTAVLVIITGIVGAIGARYVYRVLHIEDDAVRGFAMGIAAHGIGTARAFQENEQTEAFAALAMGLNGLMTALLLPLVTPWLLNWSQRQATASRPEGYYFSRPAAAGRHRSGNLPHRQRRRHRPGQGPGFSVRSARRRRRSDPLRWLGRTSLRFLTATRPQSGR